MLLVRRFLRADHGFVSRRSMEKVGFDGDYDHLARFGEWTEADVAQKTILR